MSKVVNLNTFRKAKQKQARRKVADENAVKFGLTKAEKARDALRKDKAQRDVDNHQISDDTDLPDR